MDPISPFPIHPEGFFTMNQELLNLLLGVQGAHILDYLKAKETEISGAKTLEVGDHSGFFPPLTASPQRTVTYAQLIGVLERQRSDIRRAYSNSPDFE